MNRRRLLTLLAIVALAALSASAPASRASLRHRTSRRSGHHRSATVLRVHRVLGASPPPLVFGIYPGGAAGAVGPSGAPVPENAAQRLAALQKLRPPARPFVLRLYASYTGPGGLPAALQVGQDIAAYSRAGFEIELVLAYRPAGGGSSADVTGFADFVRSTVDAFGADQRFVSLQVTNEANVSGAPNSSDGYYRGAEDALIDGVVAAKQAVDAGGFTQVRIGFNWAYSTDPGQPRFWQYLAEHGSRAFTAALDWVGLDIYPATWSPLPGHSGLARGTSRAIGAALRTLRERYMPMGHISPRVSLHISENGYPTGPGRTDRMQTTAMIAAISTIDRLRGAYDITDYRWFDLRDANSASGSFEDHYGLLDDSYAPKPAFEVYRQIVSDLGVPRGRPMSPSLLRRLLRHQARRRAHGQGRR